MSLRETVLRETVLRETVLRETVLRETVLRETVLMVCCCCCRNLEHQFGSLLRDAALHSTSPLIVFIDGLDLLSEDHEAHQLHWIPDSIPEVRHLTSSLGVDHITIPTKYNKIITIIDFFCANILEDQAQWHAKTKGLIYLKKN